MRWSCCASWAPSAYIGINLNTPYAGFNRDVFVDLPKGTSARQMAAMLQDAGVIRHSWTFLVARALRRGATLQAGEYRFTQRGIGAGCLRPHPARRHLLLRTGGARRQEHVRHRRGDRAAGRVFRRTDSWRRPATPRRIRDLDPQAPTLEGYLFPNTYRLSRTTTPEQLCLIMTGKFREVWRGLRTDASVHRTVTLASLVEKEGKLPDERPVIASVFARRLAIGMKLDCDPTTIYAALLAGNYRGAIHKSDLANDDPYNTLPACGSAARSDRQSRRRLDRRGACIPADTDYLYFVARADGSGGHNFSATLAAQQANVVKYRRATANRR